MAAMALWVGCCTALGLFAARQRTEIVLESDVEDRPIQAGSDGYVTSHSCQSCHPDAYHSWHSSYHRSMTQLPSAGTVLGDFDNAKVSFHGRTYRLELEGDDFWAEYDDPDAGKSFGGNRRVRKQIKLLTGSHHMQVYWVSADGGRKLDILPIVWLKEAERWIPRSASFIQPPSAKPDSESGRWNDGCVLCHSTQEQPRLGDSNGMDTRVGEFGIACEACHGPGEAHIRRHSSPLARYAGHLGDATEDVIAQPEKLPAGRASEVCGQCHSVSLDASSEDYAHWKQHGKRYRPGDVMADSLVTVTITNKPFMEMMFGEDGGVEGASFWRDGMVRVAGREYNGLLETRCHSHGEGDRKMTCMSCHQLHPGAASGRDLAEWADDQLKPGMRGNQACLQCHEEYDAKLEQHTRHARGSAGSLCYNCHMPHTAYGLLKAARSHRLDSPSVAVSIETGRPNACNQCHLDKTLEWTADRLNEWYGIPRPALSSDEVDVAAALLWALKGDAGQRALMAWSFGWDAAKEVSGQDWMAPILAALIADPYDAVRYIALRSLRRLPGFEEYELDFMARQAELIEGSDRVFEIWENVQRKMAANSELLVGEGREFQVETFNRLLQEQDRSPVVINE